MCYFTTSNSKNEYILYLKQKQLKKKDKLKFLTRKNKIRDVPFNNSNNDSINILRYVGEKSEKIFQRNGINTIKDLYNWKAQHNNSQDFINSLGTFPNKIYAHIKWIEELYD